GANAILGVSLAVAKAAGYKYVCLDLDGYRTGAMNEATLLALLEDLPRGITEIYFHPCLDATDGPGSPDEVRALTSAKVRQALAERDIVPIGFGDLDPQATRTERTEILD
ncbi:MAG: hypothetical protein P8Y25_15265, partial [Chromatiaceae bacterium]